MLRTANVDLYASDGEPHSPVITSNKKKRPRSTKKQQKSAGGGRPKKEPEAYIYESYRELSDQLWEDGHDYEDLLLLEQLDGALSVEIHNSAASSIYEKKFLTDSRFEKFLAKEDSIHQQNLRSRNRQAPPGISWRITVPSVPFLTDRHDVNFNPYQPYQPPVRSDKPSNTTYYPIYGDDFSDDDEIVNDEDWCELFDTVPVRRILKKRKLKAIDADIYKWGIGHNSELIPAIADTFQDIMSVSANFNPRTTQQSFLKQHIQSLRPIDQYYFQVDQLRDRERMKETYQKWNGVVASARLLKRNPLFLSIAKQCRDIVMARIEKVQSAQTLAATSAKKLNKEMLAFWKKHEKEITEKRKKKVKEEQEKLEAQRQQRKLNFLLTQTELYSHFMAKKGITHTAEQDEEARKNAERAYLIQRERTQTFDRSVERYRSQRIIEEPDEEIVSEPSIFRGDLKQYQLRGLRWLVSLYDQGINGILADEMGLGKTIQTIAFLSYLAEKRDIWGPFMIVSPSSTLHNWQQEIEKFCPELKVLPYWGSVKDRKILRKFWSPPEKLYQRNSPFHIVITSYGLILEDEKAFNKIHWQYLILDEAHAIKSSKSQRWQTLLNFRCRNRMLLTGTPIQNNMQELWALLHFIMPSLFDSHEEFNEWFSKDIENNAAAKVLKKKSDSKLDEQQLQRLHLILKPFMLRRVKRDVESEMAPKIEKIMYCGLNREQQIMYTELRKAVKEAGVKNSFGLTKKSLMNMVMHLRKVCNHPHLFIVNELDINSPLLFGPPFPFIRTLAVEITGIIPEVRCDHSRNLISYVIPQIIYKNLISPSRTAKQILLERRFVVTNSRDFLKSEYGSAGLVVPIERGENVQQVNIKRTALRKTGSVLGHLMNVQDTMDEDEDYIQRKPKQIKYLIAEIQAALHDKYNAARSLLIGDQTHETYLDNVVWRKAKFSSHQCSKVVAVPIEMVVHNHKVKPLPKIFNPISRFISIPSLSKIIGDSGKLRALDQLLIKLKKEGHRVLIFCQMTRMLDLLEYYMIRRHYRYFRMDGSTILANRRDMVSQFQQPNSPVFAFLLSTRAGGLGINLTAADTVIFYDKDWNPTLDAQAMDRVHRIGQTKQVTIYHMITRNTIEERIMTIARQKSTIQATVYGEGASSSDVLESAAIVDDPNQGVDDNKVAAMLFEDIQKDQDIIHQSDNMEDTVDLS
jgi:DNA helicase INO80